MTTDNIVKVYRVQYGIHCLFRQTQIVDTVRSTVFDNVVYCHYPECDIVFLLNVTAETKRHRRSPSSKQMSVKKTGQENDQQTTRSRRIIETLGQQKIRLEQNIKKRIDTAAVQHPSFLHIVYLVLIPRPGPDWGWLCRNKSTQPATQPTSGIE